MQKSILITGCASGIGLASARGLKAAGWRVFATCRQEADCARLRDEGFDSFALDYAESGSISAAVAQLVQATGGRLDALYNNGAFACPGAVEDLPRAALREILEVNLLGVHELTCQILPLMRAQGHGTIINCSSVLGLVPMKWRGAYVASKFALEGLSDCLRLEMRGTGIDVVLIEPGPITSRIRENSVPHFEKWIRWETSARAEEYRSIIHRLYRSKGAPDRFELGPEAVAALLQRILATRRPKARYRITKATHLMAFARWILPQPALDWLILRG